MIFSDPIDKQGIVEEIDFTLGTDSNDYPIAQKTRNINRWLDRVISLILQADKKWEWDDSNYTDLPIATTALVANQQDYSISGAGFLRILKVECKNSSGNWIPLTQIDQSQKKTIAMAEYRKTAGTPAEFDLVANSIVLYPKSSYASAAALKVYFQRRAEYFVATDTTKAPGFAEPFHRLLSYGPSLDYAMAKSMMGKLTVLRDEIAKLEQGLVEHYSNRNRDYKERITLEHEDYGVDDQTSESVDWKS